MPEEKKSNGNPPFVRDELEDGLLSRLAAPLLMLIILPLLLVADFYSSSPPVQRLTDSLTNYAYQTGQSVLNLGRPAEMLPLVPNLQYEKSGSKSYVHLIRKYHMTPTKPGPFSLGPVLHQTGKPGGTKPIGGRAFVQHILQKKTTPEYDGIPKWIPIDVGDVQNEYEVLVEVGIGSPQHQVPRVGVDTASNDFWVSLRLILMMEDSLWALLNEKFG